MASVAEIIVHGLVDAGVRTLFGMPGGGSSLDLIDAAGRAGLRFVMTSTETAGAIAAIAQTEITGRPGACLASLGPGAASVVNGVACAHLDRAPIAVFTDSHSESAGAFPHQRLDHAALFGSITKYSRQIAPGDAGKVVAIALELASTWPQGPVHLDCAGDVAAAVALESPEPGVGRSVFSAAIGGKPAAATRSFNFERLVSRSRKPLFLVGLGARRAADAQAIRTLCEAFSVPAMVTYKAKGVVPDHHPWFAGVFTNGAIEGPVLAEADLLIGVGLDPVELLPRRWSFAAPIVGIAPWQMPTGQVPFVAQLDGAIPALLQMARTHLSKSDWRADNVAAHAADQRRRIIIPVASSGLTAQDVVETVAAQLAPRARVTVDAGAHMFPATMLWPVSEPNRMLISNGLSTMGFALPAAVGAAVLESAGSRQAVVALTGDGGLLMCAGELLTAVRERLRVIVIVFSDASLSLIDIKQRQRGFQPVGVDLGRVDWRALAASVGMRGSTVSTAQELSRAVTDAAAFDGPSLIEAKIDPSNYSDTLKAIRG